MMITLKGQPKMRMMQVRTQQMIRTRSQIPNQHTVPKRNTLNDPYVEEELLEEGSGCDLDSEAEYERRSYLVDDNDGIDIEKDGDKNCVLLKVGDTVHPNCVRTPFVPIGWTDLVLMQF
eukprot:14818794-Ditylum_brightwellii.AAC.1